MLINYQTLNVFIKFIAWELFSVLKTFDWAQATTATTKATTATTSASVTRQQRDSNSNNREKENCIRFSRTYTYRISKLEPNNIFTQTKW